jgi:host factor-I protein
LAEGTKDEQPKPATGAAERRKGGKAGGPVRSLQDTFLHHLKETQTPVTVFLVSGVKLQGRVSDFDGFTVALTRDGATQLVYKRVISTVAPLGPIDLYGGDRDDGEPRRPRPAPGPPRGPRRAPASRPIIERRKLT